MFDIVYEDTAIDDLRWFTKYEQTIIIDAIEHRLRYEPAHQTRNRKRLRANPVATWELRIGRFRVLYDVDMQIQIVAIQRIEKKGGNAFFFQGRQEDI